MPKPYIKAGTLRESTDAVWELRKQVQQLVKQTDKLLAAQVALHTRLDNALNEIKNTHARLMRTVPKAVAALTEDALIREQFHQDHQR